MARWHEGTKVGRGILIVNLQSAICNLQFTLTIQRAGAGHRLRGAAGWGGGERRHGPVGATVEDAGPHGLGEAALVEAVLEAVGGSRADDEPLARWSSGFPKRLDGSPNDQTPKVEAFVGPGRPDRGAGPAPGRATHKRRAESRLAVHEKDWRRRKQMLDAAAAAVMLQNYLDAHRPAPVRFRSFLTKCADSSPAGRSGRDGRRRGRLLLRARR